MSQHFAETYDFIERHLQAGHNTLVHCHAGKSRSVTIVIAYLMKKYTWTYDQALAYVKQRRPRVKPNDSFVLQLKQF
jgi:protein-tyrosine phosphatase